MKRYTSDGKERKRKLKGKNGGARKMEERGMEQEGKNAGVRRDLLKKVSRG